MLQLRIGHHARSGAAAGSTCDALSRPTTLVSNVWGPGRSVVEHGLSRKTGRHCARKGVKNAKLAALDNGASLLAAEMDASKPGHEHVTHLIDMFDH